MKCPNCNAETYQEVVVVLLEKKEPTTDSGHEEIRGSLCTECYCFQEE